MMLYKLIPPPSVKATIQLPASKSISNRALIINALGKGIYSPEGWAHYKVTGEAAPEE